jgi:hypothetical protein
MLRSFGGMAHFDIFQVQAMVWAGTDTVPSL